MNALEWIGIAVGTVGVVALATRDGQPAAAPAGAAPPPARDNSTPPPVTAPPPPPLPPPPPANPTGTQARPFAPGWLADSASQNAAWATLRSQLPALGFPCTDDASCVNAERAFALSEGLPDPTGPSQNHEAARQAFFYAADDKFRRVSGMAPASDALTTAGLFSPARYRRRM